MTLQDRRIKKKSVQISQGKKIGQNSARPNFSRKNASCVHTHFSPYAHTRCFACTHTLFSCAYTSHFRMHTQVIFVGFHTYAHMLFRMRFESFLHAHICYFHVHTCTPMLFHMHTCLFLIHTQHIVHLVCTNRPFSHAHSSILHMHSIVYFACTQSCFHVHTFCSFHMNACVLCMHTKMNFTCTPQCIWHALVFDMYTNLHFVCT